MKTIDLDATYAELVADDDQRSAPGARTRSQALAPVSSPTPPTRVTQTPKELEGSVPSDDALKALCEHIRANGDLRLSARLCDLDPEVLVALHKHGRNRKGDTRITRLFKAIDRALAEHESDGVKNWRMGDRHQVDAHRSFLQATNPKYSPKIRVQVEYEVNIVINVLREVVDEYGDVGAEIFTKFLQRAAVADEQALVFQQDS